jgi:hypothetical protein
MTPRILTLVSFAGFLAMIVSLSVLIMNQSLVGESVIPIAVQILAVCLMVWARVTFGRSIQNTRGEQKG